MNAQLTTSSPTVAKRILDDQDRITELDRFCIELGRELTEVQRERAALWEENQRLRAALRRIADYEMSFFLNPHPSLEQSRHTVQTSIGIAKTALSDKE